MKKLHFDDLLSHVEDGVCISDPNGQEFPADASAMQEAAKLAKGLSKYRIQAHPWHVLVKNADGRLSAQLPCVSCNGNTRSVPMRRVSR